MVSLENQVSHGNKDLLRLEHTDSSCPIPGSKLLSICKEDDKDMDKKKNQKNAQEFFQALGESSVLNRVKAFLPILDESNKKLTMEIKEKGADGFNIEVLKEDADTPYVEMDLALGVADLHTPDALLAAERLIGGRASVVETNADSDTEESETEEDDKKNILQCRRTKRPKIEALN